MNIDLSKLDLKIASLNNDSIELSDKIYYDFSTTNSQSLINDSSYDASPAVVLDDLSLEEITDIAEKTLRSYNNTIRQIINNVVTDLTSKETRRKVATAILKGADWVDNGVEYLADKLNDIKGKIGEGANELYNTLSEIIQQEGMGGLASTLAGITSVIADGLADYQDGIKETTFGSIMENSWYGTSNSFLDYFNNNYSGVAAESRKINIMASTPLDPTDSRSSLYGTMILGTPYSFTPLADPNNRTLINSFVKDGRILSLTPGMPKFNGLTSYSNIQNSILNQTDTPDEMIAYLERNGLDKGFTDKDKRYYTFEAKYNDYFAYLETMLNAVWIKLGLAKNGEQFNIFSFFNIKKSSEGGIEPSAYDDLKSQYNSSIGFYTNIANSISESIDSQTTSHGADLASRANANAADYQKINYITGMGTGGSVKNAARSIGIGLNSASQIKQLIGETFQSTGNALSNFSTNGNSRVTRIIRGALSTAKVIGGVATDVINFSNTQDLGAVIQSFATSNGMMVVYPELWSNSSYSKNMNFDFTFTSPYGDPLSIFRYVYVPFFALACFALPRQAAENGYVSPFFVRADVPGLITSDLGMITSLTFTKGGSNNLWTKDGLPRSIECTITVTDLYPYLSMTKRLSFLSANPSYTVFLDNLTGLCALHDDTSDDILNEYFKSLIDRVNGTSNNRSTLWNKFNSSKTSENLRAMNANRMSISGTLGKHSIPWLHNSSI